MSNLFRLRTCARLASSAGVVVAMQLVLGTALAAPPDAAPPAAVPPAAAAEYKLSLGGELIAFDEIRERDSDGDGGIDQRAWYASGEMVAAAFDMSGGAENKDPSVPVFDAWVRFDAEGRVRQEWRDRDHDGRPDESLELGADARPQGEPQTVDDVEPPDIAPAVPAEAPPEPEPVAPAETAEPSSAPDGLPLDWRLWAAIGIFGVSLIPAGLSLRRR